MFGLLFLAAVCATASSAEQTAGPAFVWGDAPVSGQNAGHSTVYQVGSGICCALCMFWRVLSATEL